MTTAAFRIIDTTPEDGFQGHRLAVEVATGRPICTVVPLHDGWTAGWPVYLDTVYTHPLLAVFAGIQEIETINRERAELDARTCIGPCCDEVTP